jgi:glycosyltransferase involved in cell wall biosynthesis/phosphoheptose isomerase
MRIAMVSEHASPLAVLGGEDAGGQNVHVAALATELGRRGCEVVVHTRRDDPRTPRRVPLARGVTVDHVAAGPPSVVPKDALLPYMDAFAGELERAWRAQRPDVVHAHFWMSAYAALHAARGLGIPVVQTFHALGNVKRRHQGDRDTSPPRRQEIERKIIRTADRIVSTCTDEAFELVRLGADRMRLVVIPCGVDLRRFRPDGPADPRLARGRRIACVGRLVERKGVGNVITALATLPDTQLVIAGGPARDKLAGDAEARRLLALADEYGVADRVDLRGRVRRDDLPSLLRSCDVVVCAPWYEPFGIVPLEAMACGVPVIASAVGGLVDTVVEGVTGVHVPPRDPDRLADALRGLLDDRAARERMGRAGVERARRHYDWGRIGDQTLDAYAPLVHRHDKPARRLKRAPASVARLERDALIDGLKAAEPAIAQAETWGERLAEMLLGGARLLVAGNGGSAAQAQHLTAELVGRFETERRPLSALCLHGDTSSLTAIVNDYGADDCFARQVCAHARPGDVLLLLSTSGRSSNLLAAARAARALGITTWAMTGRAPNPLAGLCDEAAAVDVERTATVQELQLVAIHVVCGAVDRAVERLEGVPTLAEVLPT